MDNFDKISMGDIDDNPLRNSIEQFRIETDSENDKYELLLRGYSKKPGTNVWLKTNGSGNRFNMSDEAVNYIVTARCSVIGKGTLQANFSGENKWKMYDDSVSAFMDAFEGMFLVNGEDWNLTTSQVNSLASEMEEFYRLMLTRPLDNKERDRDKPNESFNHSDNMNLDDKGFK